MAGALAVAGCTSAPEDGDGDKASKAGGNLVLGTSSPLRSFDPFTLSLANFPIHYTLYSFLIKYDADLKPQPDLAESWQIADDNKSVTIKLKDAVFSDGSPLTAEDVVVGVKRAQDPKIGGNLLAPTKIVKSATAVDAHTVRVDFKQPTGEDTMLDWMYVLPIVKADHNTPDQLMKAPAGSGPFVLESYSPGDKLVLKKNPRYYNPSRPYLDSVEFRFFDDKDSLVATLQAGGIDGALNVGAQYLDQVRETFTVIPGAETAYVNVLMLNPTKAPFDNKLCRQAIGRAIDRERIIKTVQNGLGAATTSPFSPVSPAYDKSMTEAHGFDLEAAKAGIDASCSSRTATAMVQPTAGILPTMQIIQESLKTIGFDLKIQTVDFPTWLTKFTSADFQATINGTTNAYRSPSALTRSGVMSTGLAPEEFSVAIAAAQSASTPDEVAAANKQINQILADQAWAIGINTRTELFVLDKKVVGFARNPAGRPMLIDTYIQ